MILEHSVQLLCKGKSSARQNAFTAALQVMFKLQSGVQARKIDGLKTALLMIEVIKVQQKTLDQADQYQRFDNFVQYIFGRFNEPMAMALVKYAIADRNLTIKKLADSSSWARISQVFKPVMLDNSKDPRECAKYARFEKLHARLKGFKPMSLEMNQYLQGEDLTSLGC